MSRITTTLAVAAAIALGGTAQAQRGQRPIGPPVGGAPSGTMIGRPGLGGPSAAVASMLLAHTGEFKLTDAQVTRLAAIARRTSDRQRATRASLDSMRSTVSAPANPAPGAVARPSPTPAMLALAERMREQEHADLRDAIAILTPEQQALGWEMMSRRGGTRMGAGAGPGTRPARMRQGVSPGREQRGRGPNARRRV